MGIALLARAAQVGVDLVETGEIANETVLGAPGGFAARTEIASLEEALIADDGRAHGAVLVRTGAQQERFLMPESEAHSLIV